MDTRMSTSEIVSVGDVYSNFDIFSLQTMLAINKLYFETAGTNCSQGRHQKLENKTERMIMLLASPPNTT